MADKDDDILEEARERFSEAEDAWSESKAQSLDDMKFGRLGEQWPADIKQRRQVAGRPCMTINRMPAFARQVTNDARQNRPAIKVRPVDSDADVQTAEIMTGLIRHIEQISDADIAYDTGVENAVHGGFGFIEIDVDYACDDSFDKEITIKQVANPQAVSWDPYTEAYDSSDWDYAFKSWTMPQEQFKKKYPKKQFEASGFASDAAIGLWFEAKNVRLSSYYSREEKPRTIVQLSDGSVVDEEIYAKQKEIFDAAGLTFVRERETQSYEIVRRLITGLEILETQRWRGSIIPLVPIYGDAFSIEGRRYMHSLIHDAKDAQRIFNFERSVATELSGMAPKVPFIGKKGTFDVDPEKWATINQENWPYIQYAGEMPQRQPFMPVATGAIEQASLASEDMKTIIGISNPSMGMPDTRVISGKAKQMERAESDTGTYHFHDNQHRSIRCVGRVVLELIPQVYTGERILRIIGQDGKPQQVQLGKPVQYPNGTSRIFNLTLGKYDLTVEAGPSYTTKREEAVDALSTIISNAPQSAPILAPQLIKMYDMPDAEKVTAMMATIMPPAARAVFDGTPVPPPSPPPEVMAAQEKAKNDMALSHQKAQQDFQLEQQKGQTRAQIEQTQAQADIAVMQQKAQAEIVIMQNRANAEMQLKREEAKLAAELKMIGAAQSQTAIAPGVQ